MWYEKANTGVKQVEYTRKKKLVIALVVFHMTFGSRTIYVKPIFNFLVL